MDVITQSQSQYTKESISMTVVIGNFTVCGEQCQNAMGTKTRENAETTRDREEMSAQNISNNRNEGRQGEHYTGNGEGEARKSR